MNPHFFRTCPFSSKLFVPISSFNTSSFRSALLWDSRVFHPAAWSPTTWRNDAVTAAKRCGFAIPYIRVTTWSRLLDLYLRILDLPCRIISSWTESWILSAGNGMCAEIQWRGNSRRTISVERRGTPTCIHLWSATDEEFSRRSAVTRADYGSCYFRLLAVMLTSQKLLLKVADLPKGVLKLDQLMARITNGDSMDSVSPVLNH